MVRRSQVRSASTPLALLLLYSVFPSIKWTLLAHPPNHSLPHLQTVDPPYTIVPPFFSALKLFLALFSPRALLQDLTVILLCLRSFQLGGVSPVCLLTFPPLLCPLASGRPLPRCTSKCCRQTTRVLRASPDNNTTWRSAKPWGLGRRCSTCRCASTMSAKNNPPTTTLFLPWDLRPPLIEVSRRNASNFVDLSKKLKVRERKFSQTGSQTHKSSSKSS